MKDIEEEADDNEQGSHQQATSNEYVAWTLLNEDATWASGLVDAAFGCTIVVTSCKDLSCKESSCC